MSRTLHFQQIVDSRFQEEGTDLKNMLLQRVQAINEALEQLPGVTVQTGHPRKLTFPPNSSVQWRTAFYVTKEGRKTTWEQIYETVNRFSAPYYSFL